MPWMGLKMHSRESSARGRFSVQEWYVAHRGCGPGSRAGQNHPRGPLFVAGLGSNEPGRAPGVSFIETVERARALLGRNGRLSLRALKREFGLDDAALDELVAELVDVQQAAALEGKILSWIGAAPTESPTTRPATQGERRQLTVSSVTWLARRISPSASTRRTCATSCAPTRKGPPG